MSKSTFKILFYIKRNSLKKSGLVPIMCRITINGTVSQFSCKIDIDEKYWNAKRRRMSGRGAMTQEVNQILDKISLRINSIYYDMITKDRYITAEKVRNAFLGIGQDCKTLLAVFRRHNEDYAKQVGKMKSQRSYWKYCTVYNHLEEFIKHRYKVSDIALHELSPAFITDFELFLRSEKNHCTNTVWSYMMPLRHIIYNAINNGWLQYDPFHAYRIAKEETPKKYLTKEEIKMLINLKLENRNYELIRDLFIFCCFSGLSWSDMYNLTTDNLYTSFDGHLWIKINRQKTGTETNIRLLDTAKRIIEKYNGMTDGNKLLPVPCYANCRYGIKIVAKLSGINKNVCWHQSRHSYATTICLSNGVPIETLSKLMGHKSIRSTQIYAKIIAQKVSDDIENLSKQIEYIEDYICSRL